MYGTFNIGLLKHNDPLRSYRRKGWGGYREVLLSDTNMLLTPVWRAGYEYRFVGYAHFQYDKYNLGGEYVNSVGTQEDQTMDWSDEVRRESF